MVRHDLAESAACWATYLGGEWAARRAVSNERLQLIGTGIAYGAAGLASVAIYFRHQPPASRSPRTRPFYGRPLARKRASLCHDPDASASERMRVMSIATIYFFANLIGMGLGPLAAGALSDLFRPVHGEESLRYALLTLCPGYVWAAWYVACKPNGFSRTLQHETKRSASDARIRGSRSALPRLSTARHRSDQRCRRRARLGPTDRRAMLRRRAIMDRLEGTPPTRICIADLASGDMNIRKARVPHRRTERSTAGAVLARWGRGHGGRCHERRATEELPSWMPEVDAKDRAPSVADTCGSAASLLPG